MPSIGRSSSTSVHRQIEYGRESLGYESEERCGCCPYGYHIDLDFVPFSKKMLSREGDFERLKELKDKWRSDRQSMDKLLGVNNITNGKTWSLSSSLLSNHVGQSKTRTKTGTGSSGRRISGEYEEYEGSQKLFSPTTPTTPTTPSFLSSLRAVGRGSSSSSVDLILENGLSEAVTDFEEALLRTRPQAKILSYEIPDSQKFHTFPRIKAPALKDPLIGGNSNNLTISSIFRGGAAGSGSSTTTSSSTVIMFDSIVKNTGSSFKKAMTETESKHESLLIQDELEKGVGDSEVVELETKNKLINDLEEKVKELSVEKSELTVALEAEKVKLQVSETNLLKAIRGSGSETRLKSTRDACVGRVPSTREMGVNPVLPRTRSVGVGGSLDLWDRASRGESTSPTGSLSGTLKRRLKMFDASVQVKEYDFPPSPDFHAPPVLQIVEGVECGVQVDTGMLEPSSLDQDVKAPPRKKHAGIMAKPSTVDSGVTHKPSVRSCGISTADSSTCLVKHVGINTVMEEKEKNEKPKTTRAISTSTDRLRTSSIAVNTIMEPRRNLCLTSTASQTGMESDSLESVGDISTLSSMTFPLSALSLPLTSSSSTMATSQPLARSPDAKGVSKIPRLTSPIGSPSAIQRTSTHRNIAASTQDRSVSPNSPRSSGTSSPCPAEACFSTPAPKTYAFQRHDAFNVKDMHIPERQGIAFGTLEPLEEEDREGLRSSSASSSSGLPPLDTREKICPSKEMQAALKVLNDALLRGKTTLQVTNAISIILHEWFRVAGTKTAKPFDVEDYLDSFEIYSPTLLRYIVNMPDGNGNTALHYAVSHGNFDVVSILLDSKVCDPNKANKAGYTSIMLVALANISCEAHRQVVRRLFSMGDVNIKAAQHGQTALMLGASHGRYDTVKLLLEAGADINIQDEDGSTALMCAAEHAHVKIAKYLLSHPDCDPQLTDHDGSTAFSIAMEGKNKDIGVLLYTQMHLTPNPSGGTMKSRSTTPSAASSRPSSGASSANTSPTALKRPADPALPSSKS